VGGAGFLGTWTAAPAVSLGWMVLVGAAILVEKVTPIGVAASRGISVALAAAAVAWAL
jgi:predicted metal-binding membrane protein